MKENMNFGDKVEASAIRRAGHSERLGLSGKFLLEAFDKHGNLKWSEEFDNLVTDVGEDDVLDKYFKGSTYTAAHYVGLTDGTPTVAETDTMASHAGWTEVTAYTEGTREVLTMGTVSSQSVNNSASKASFSINANGTTIGGCFVATSSTKGESASTLYSVGAFSAGDKTLDNGDTLNVTYTANAGGA